MTHLIHAFNTFVVLFFLFLRHCVCFFVSLPLFQPRQRTWSQWRIAFSCFLSLKITTRVCSTLLLLILCLQCFVSNSVFLKMLYLLHGGVFFPLSFKVCLVICDVAQLFLCLTPCLNAFRLHCSALFTFFGASTPSLLKCDVYWCFCSCEQNFCLNVSRVLPVILILNFCSMFFFF